MNDPLARPTAEGGTPDHTQDQRPEQCDRPQNRHLKPWQAGRSGNPGGRPKGQSLTAALRADLAAPHGETGMTRAEALAARLVDQALAGDGAAARLVWERAEGKVPARPEDDLSHLSDEELIARVKGLLPGGKIPGQVTLYLPDNSRRPAPPPDPAVPGLLSHLSAAELASLEAMAVKLAGAARPALPASEG